MLLLLLLVLILFYPNHENFNVCGPPRLFLISSTCAKSDEFSPVCLQQYVLETSSWCVPRALPGMSYAFMLGAKVLWPLLCPAALER